MRTSQTAMLSGCHFGVVLVAALLSMTPIGITQARSSTDVAQVRLEQCRDGCLKKFATDDISCLQAPECSTCWDDCSTAATSSINRAVPATWLLSVTSMIRDGSLVTANVAWHSEPLAPKAPSDCLVTWEVSGGGLIGNLLTQTPSVELSLWPDTKYRVQVTCKSKTSEDISRSIPLTIDTSTALVIVRIPTIAPRRNAQSNANIRHNSNDAVGSYNNHYASYMALDQPALMRSFQGTVSRWSHLFANHGAELALGCLAAVLAFAILTGVVFIVNRRKSRTIAGRCDKAPLVDNEVSVNVDVDRLTIHV